MINTKIYRQLSEEYKQQNRRLEDGETIIQRLSKPRVVKGTKLHDGEIVVTLKYKRYRRVVYLKRDSEINNQETRILRELRVLHRDISLPSIISQYSLDE